MIQSPCCHRSAAVFPNPQAETFLNVRPRSSGKKKPENLKPIENSLFPPKLKSLAETQRAWAWMRALSSAGARVV